MPNVHACLRDACSAIAILPKGSVAYACIVILIARKTHTITSLTGHHFTKHQLTPTDTNTRSPLATTYFFESNAASLRAIVLHRVEVLLKPDIIEYVMPVSTLAHRHVMALLHLMLQGDASQHMWLLAYCLPPWAHGPILACLVEKRSAIACKLRD